MTDIPPYVSLETLASMLDVGESTIEAWVGQGRFPPPKRLGPNGMRRWSWAEVQRHIEGPAPIKTEGGITNGTRQARLERGLRVSNPGLSGIAQISKSGT